MLAPPLPFLLPALVALPLLAALAAIFLPRGRFALGAAISLIGLALAAGIARAVLAHGPVEAVFAWAPSLGVTAALRADGLGALFALLITGIGTMVFAYAGAYLAPGQARDRAAVLLLLFQGSMLGAVLADDLVLLFVFWEATSLISFLLVGYDHESASARRAALQGLLVTVGGGLALLAGCIVLAAGSGTLRLDATLRTETAATLPALLLLALAAFTKSAQMPFQFWLPNAMAAPTPVSAYLHSATMVKLGVYLLARFDPLFGADPVWRGLLAAIGTATMLIGALLALRETDLKRVLAHSTVTALGTLTMLVGLDTPMAALAFVVFLAVHALYKAALFFAAGILDHATGTRDARRLAGLARLMPLTAAAALLAAASMAGLPPFLGFLAKESIYAAQLGAGFGGLLVACAVIANGATIGVAALVALRPFLGRPVPALAAAHDPAWAMLAPPLLAGMLGLALGAMPSLAAPLLAAAAGALAPGAPIPALALWHGFGAELALSLATILLGIAIHRSWAQAQPVLAGLDAIDRFGAERGYATGLDAVLAVAKRQTAALQTGSLRSYLARIALVIAVALLGVLMARGGLAMPAPRFDALALLVAPLLIGSALAAMLMSDRPLAALLATGAAGVGATILFLFRGAPDLALTQIAVEALAIVLVLAVFARLDLRTPDPRPSPARRRDAAVALVFGVAIAALLFAVLAAPPQGALAEWFRAQSLVAAQGRNVVNVIIVDFRALDTLGEIAVLAFAALGVAAALRIRRSQTP